MPKPLTKQDIEKELASMNELVLRARNEILKDTKRMLEPNAVYFGRKQYYCYIVSGVRQSPYTFQGLSIFSLDAEDHIGVGFFKK